MEDLEQKTIAENLPGWKAGAIAEKGSQWKEETIEANKDQWRAEFELRSADQWTREAYEKDKGLQAEARAKIKVEERGKTSNQPQTEPAAAPEPIIIYREAHEVFPVWTWFKTEYNSLRIILFWIIYAFNWIASRIDSFIPAYTPINWITTRITSFIPGYTPTKNATLPNAVETRRFIPQTAADLPSHYNLVTLFCHLWVYLFVLSCYTERSIWLAANESTRQWYFDLVLPKGNRTRWGFRTPFTWSKWIADWIEYFLLEESYILPG